MRSNPSLAPVFDMKRSYLLLLKSSYGKTGVRLTYVKLELELVRLTPGCAYVRGGVGGREGIDYPGRRTTRIGRTIGDIKWSGEYIYPRGVLW